MAEQQPDQSVYNIALDYLKELMANLKECNERSKANDFYGWSRVLDTIYTTADMVMTDKERDQQKQHMSLISRTFSEVESDNMISKQEEAQLRNVLGTYEIFLRRVCYAHELLLPKKGDIHNLFSKGMY